MSESVSLCFLGDSQYNTCCQHITVLDSKYTNVQGIINFNSRQCTIDFKSEFLYKEFLSSLHGKNYISLCISLRILPTFFDIEAIPVLTSLAKVYINSKTINTSYGFSVNFEVDSLFIYSEKRSINTTNDKPEDSNPLESETMLEIIPANSTVTWSAPIGGIFNSSSKHSLETTNFSSFSFKAKRVIVDGEYKPVSIQLFSITTKKDLPVFDFIQEIYAFNDLAWLILDSPLVPEELKLCTANKSIKVLLNKNLLNSNICYISDSLDIKSTRYSAIMLDKILSVIKTYQTGYATGLSMFSMSERCFSLQFHEFKNEYMFTNSFIEYKICRYTQILEGIYKGAKFKDMSLSSVLSSIGKLTKSEFNLLKIDKERYLHEGDSINCIGVRNRCTHPWKKETVTINHNGAGETDYFIKELSPRLLYTCRCILLLSLAGEITKS